MGHATFSPDRPRRGIVRVSHELTALAKVSLPPNHAIIAIQSHCPAVGVDDFLVEGPMMPDLTDEDGNPPIVELMFHDIKGQDGTEVRFGFWGHAPDDKWVIDLSSL